MANYEGFNVPGSVPQRDNNPLDLRHSPNSSHEGEGPNDIGEIPTPQLGWADAEGQLAKWAARGLTLAQMMAIDAPTTENDTAAYLAYICQAMPCTPDMRVSDILKIT
jgi:hypothetical protein